MLKRTEKVIPEYKMFICEERKQLTLIKSVHENQLSWVKERIKKIDDELGVMDAIEKEMKNVQKKE